jgi:hypothetical protein
MTRRALVRLAAALSLPAFGQAPPDPFVCPMDRDVRQRGPGKCPRCGMKLVADLPAHRDYGLSVATIPRLLRPGVQAVLRFTIRHPQTAAVVRDFELVHERIFHLFVVGDDLSFFAHEHPERQPDGSFVLPLTLPSAGSYRVVADFFPAGGTPQFLTATLFTAGASLRPKPVLRPDSAAKHTPNLTVEMSTQPAEPLAGQETLLFFRLKPSDAIEQYLGAWGHMLVASDDLIDVIHDHPLYVDGVAPPDLKQPFPSQIQFNVIFPREASYRVWVQFQRKGVVNTAAFTVPVKALR